MELIDYSIVIIVLVFTLATGLFVSKNVNSMKEFSVGDRNYSSTALLATLVASYVGAGFTFGLTSKTFEYGILYVLGLFGFSLQQLLVGIYIAPRMESYRESLSVGDIIYKFYGSTGRKITGICSIMTCAGMLGAQVSATGYVFQVFLGVEKSIGIIVGCGIVMIYSITGGMRAGVATDIFQFILLIILLPLTAIMGVFYIGGIDVVSTELYKDLITNGIDNIHIVSTIILFLVMLVGETLIPPAVQRLLITKKVKQTVRGTILSAIISIPFFFMIGCSGIIARIINPDLNPNISLPFLMEVVMPIGLRGMAVSAIIAVIMSSADAYLNAGAVAAVQDVIKPFSKRSIPKHKELILARIATLVIGAISIIFALSMENVLEVLLYSYNFWAPIILVPLIAGIFGYWISITGFIISGLVGFLAVMACQIFVDTSMAFLGAIINLCCFVVFYKIKTSD